MKTVEGNLGRKIHTAAELTKLLPAFPRVLERLQDKKVEGTVKDVFGGSARLVSGTTPAGANVIALDAPPDLAFAHDDPDAAHGPIHVAIVGVWHRNCICKNAPGH